MKAVGIRELKARLSHYLRDVQAGDVVLVTDRGRVVAELRAPSPGVVAESPTERAFRRLAEGGGLLSAEGRSAGSYPASPVRAPAGTAQALLAEERVED